MTIPSHLQTELDALIEETIATYDAVGLAVAIVDSKQTLKRSYWGQSSVQHPHELNEDTVFGMASITKSFTAMAIMQLVERGVLDLHSPISAYLPELHYPGAGYITLAHFLSHMAGYAPLPRIVATDLLSEVQLPAGEAADVALSPTIAAEAGRRLLERLSQPPYPMLGRPGEYLSYCNDGFAALSEIVRRHGGYPTYAEYVTANILAPLGMLRSRYDVLSLADEPNKTTLYFDVGSERRSTEDWNTNAFALCGGGTLKSTLADMERYVRCYLNAGLSDEGTRIIDSYTIAEMQKPRIRHSHQRFYGYGLMTSSLDDITICGHGGSLPGVSSDMLWSHELGLGVVVLCNTSNVPVARISTAIMKVLNNHPATEPRSVFQDRPWNAETIEAAKGTYRSGEGGVFVLSSDAEGLPQITIGPDTFPVRMVLPDLGLVRIKLNTAELRLYQKDGNVWAIGYGGRVVLREQS